MAELSIKKDDIGMKRVKLLVQIGKHPVGALSDLDDATARSLVQIGKAEYVDAPGEGAGGSAAAGDYLKSVDIGSLEYNKMQTMVKILGLKVADTRKETLIEALETYKQTLA